MADDVSFDLEFAPAYGTAVSVAPGVQRLTVNNPSPFTFHGTNSYIVGSGASVAVIDPGPEDEAHFEALIAALSGRSVSHIFVSHTHRDHSPLARRLKERPARRPSPKGRTGRRGHCMRRNQSVCRKCR